MSEASNFSRREQLYSILLGTFAVVLLMSNLITVKLIAVPFFPEYSIPCGVLTFPLIFLIGDLVTEIFGAKRARFMVYMGFLMCLIAHAMVQLGLHLQPHGDWVSANNPYGYSNAEGYELAFQSIFGLNGIALVSSMLAYAVSQLLDIRVFLFIKEITKSKHMWLRNGGSTLVTQIVDTLIVNTLFLYCGLKLDLTLVVKISLLCYLYKLFVILFSVPFFYLSVFICRRFIRAKTVSLPQPPTDLQPLESNWSVG